MAVLEIPALLGLQWRESRHGQCVCYRLLLHCKSFQQQQMLTVQITPTTMGSLLCLRSLSSSTTHLNSQVQSRSLQTEGVASSVWCKLGITLFPMVWQVSFSFANMQGVIFQGKGIKDEKDTIYAGIDPCLFWTLSIFHILRQ